MPFDEYKHGGRRTEFVWEVVEDLRMEMAQWEPDQDDIEEVDKYLKQLVDFWEMKKKHPQSTGWLFADEIKVNLTKDEIMDCIKKGMTREQILSMIHHSPDRKEILKLMGYTEPDMEKED